LVHSIGWCLPSEGLAWAAVEGGGHGLEVVRDAAGRVRDLGEVLTKQAVDVLVGAALSGAVGVGEVHLTAVSIVSGACWESSLPVPRQ
jgi:hypothetical protein